jgi:hypothetical protein
MNKSIIFTLFFTTILLSFNLYAGQEKDKPKERKIQAKCYVQMIDGSHTISLWTIKEKSFKSLAQQVNGQKNSSDWQKRENENLQSQRVCFRS